MNSSATRTPIARVAPVPAVPICFPLAGDIPVGGGHVSVLLLIRNLDRRRYRPILAVHGDGPVRRWLVEQGLAADIELLSGRIQGRRGAWVGDAVFVGRRSWALARFLRQRKVAIVHVNDTVMLGTWALATRLAGAKLLWHKRGPSYNLWMHRIWFQIADHVILISRFAAPEPPSPKCSLIYNPFEAKPALDRAAWRAAVLQETGLPADAWLLRLFGDLDKERKRPMVFVEVIARIAERLPRPVAAGLLFGQYSADTERKLRTRAESLGIACRVHLMGFRYPPDPWYAACDLLVAPSVREGFGRTLVEAMLLGTVAVAANSGGHCEIIEHGTTGFLVRPDDALAFADQICALLARPNEIARLARQACESALQRFGVARHVRAVTDVYDALLSEATPRLSAGRRGSLHRRWYQSIRVSAERTAASGEPGAPSDVAPPHSAL